LGRALITLMCVDMPGRMTAKPSPNLDDSQALAKSG
jgi:hypothetical protein